jgi:transglutaminase-like putative cysteine protease
MSAVAAPPPGRRARLASFFAPLTRLFAPQMSSAARERRDMLVLLLAVTFVVVPHFEHLAWWATAVLLLLLFWRAFLTITQQPLPGRWLMVPLLLAAGLGVYQQHRTLVGQQAGVTFLLLLMALKLLEMRARRDIFVVIFLSFFILLTQFLYGQGLHIAAMALLAVVALFFVLVSVNLDDTDLPASRKFRIVGWTVLKAVPLTLALFVLFPRISGPLWGTPGDGSTGSTGLSNSMAPGSISRLFESGEIAFRARFDGTPPGNDKLYWRGPVFGYFNGRAWSPLQQRTVNPEPLSVEADVRSETRYTVTLEPHKRDWLFALEAPAALPAGSELQAKLTPEMQLIAGDLVSQRLRYEMRSFTAFRFGAKASELELQDWRELPPNYNPRAIQFATELRSRVVAAPGIDSDAQLVTAVIDHFRRGGYQYSLAPPRLGRHSVDEFLFDTRQGYCEHYSSAFVVLMRALDIPARVVTGYQGGELNPVDNFLTVRQSDAHAWAEVWLQGRGWVRVDPTAAVAPLRIDRGAAELARQSGIVLPGAAGDFSWLRSVRFNWEAVQNAWNQWVLSYSQERQQALADLLGLAPTLESIALVLAAVIGVLLAVIAALSLRSRAVRDPLGDAYRQLRDKLDQAGVTTAEHLGPRELYSRSKRALERDDVQRARKLLSRYERMRYSRSSEGVSAADIRALRRAIRTFRPRQAAA